MIFVERVQIPPVVLTSPISPGIEERNRAIHFFAYPENRLKTFKFRAYKQGDVSRSLNALFNFKCAYCESKYAAVHPVDVEHYRPKASIMIEDQTEAKLVVPGYYWLAADWENLLPSCIDCNRVRVQHFPPGEPPRKCGKGSRFPLIDETKRASQPGQEEHEEPLLLNPCRDFPEQHLEFTSEGIVRPLIDESGHESLKGQVSIAVYGLQRLGLVQHRRARARLITAQIERVKLAAKEFDQSPRDPRLFAIAHRELRALYEYKAPDQEYAGMARQIIDSDQFMRSLVNRPPVNGSRTRQ